MKNFQIQPRAEVSRGELFADQFFEIFDKISHRFGLGLEELEMHHAVEYGLVDENGLYKKANFPFHPGLYLLILGKLFLPQYLKQVVETDDDRELENLKNGLHGQLRLLNGLLVLKFLAESNRLAQEGPQVQL